MWLYLYSNELDNKEHLAIVFGDRIRSKSLDEVRPGETERDRMVRGAYVGRLYPGRTSSRVDQLKQDARGESSNSPSSNHQPPDTPNGAPSSPSTSQHHPSALSAPPHGTPAPLVRIHSECYTGETIHSARCDCGEQLDEAARLMSLPSARSAGGAIVYLRQEGRGIGLLAKLQAYNLQDLGHDTYEANLLLRHPADARSYGLATAVLVDLGLREITLLTNNPDKVRAVEGPNREVVVRERVPMVPLSWRTGGQQGFTSPEVERYLSTKVSLRPSRETRVAKIGLTLCADREVQAYDWAGMMSLWLDVVHMMELRVQHVPMLAELRVVGCRNEWHVSGISQSMNDTGSQTQSCEELQKAKFFRISYKIYAYRNREVYERV